MLKTVRVIASVLILSSQLSCTKSQIPDPKLTSDRLQLENPAIWNLEDQLRQNLYNTDWDPEINREFQADLENPIIQSHLASVAIEHLDFYAYPFDSSRQFNYKFLEKLTTTPTLATELTWQTILKKTISESSRKRELLIDLFFDYGGILRPSVPLSVAKQVLDQNGTYGIFTFTSRSENPERQSINQLKLSLKESKLDRKKIVNHFYQLSVKSQRHLIVEADLDHDPEARRLAIALYENPKGSQRFLAAAKLFYNDDSRGKTLITKALDSNLKDLPSLSNWWLQALDRDFPNTRFAQGCREFEKIRGRAYFQNYPQYPPTKPPFNVQKSIEKWKLWLQKYPDHPGADDAQYWLARNLTWNHQRTEALKQLADLVLFPIGDDEIRFYSIPRLWVMLDAQATSGDLQSFLDRYPAHPIIPLVQYALALRLARRHQYREALQKTEHLSLDPIFKRYFLTSLIKWDFYGEYWLTHKLDPQLTQQRNRWKTLSQWQDLSNYKDRYHLAMAWVAPDGWNNGYLILYQGQRGFTFQDILQLDNSDPILQHGMREANHNAVALELLWPLLNDHRIPDPIVEESLYLRLKLLTRQYVTYPVPETEIIYPIPHFPILPKQSYYYDYLSCDNYAEYCQDSARYDHINDWYQQQGKFSFQQLLERYPQSKFQEPALFDIFWLLKDPMYLDWLATHFPQGEGSDEAQSILQRYWNRSPHRTINNNE